MGRPRLEIDIEDDLTLLFRQRGFDGASLSAIEKVSGMGKASLFHRFPGGKDDMARASISAVTTQFEVTLSRIFENSAPKLCAHELQNFFSDYYLQGDLGCIFGAFSVPETAARFRPELQTMLKRITQSICQSSALAGVSRSQAKQNAEDFLADLQGTLILSSISPGKRRFNMRIQSAVARLLKK